ncbi:MAG: hypothetical protein Q9159_000117 [Coniocarpon cinnabarinum]
MSKAELPDQDLDHWNAQAYNAAASFVPQLTTKVLQCLEPEPHEKILDIGCGDGTLSARIAAQCQTLVGLDSSTSFIQTASEKATGSRANTKFFEHDCRRLDDPQALDRHALLSGTYDKVFSNAAMHWILRDSGTRAQVLRDVLRLLKPGGSFVFEQGGFGNAAEVHATLTSVLRHAFNVPLVRIQQADPWFFPSEALMRSMLEETGFSVEKVEIEYRPTQLTPTTADGSGGLEGWIKLLAAPFLDVLDDSQARAVAVKMVCEDLREIVTRVEDGRECQYLGYVRLRAIARKPQ